MGVYQQIALSFLRLFFSNEVLSFNKILTLFIFIDYEVVYKLFK